jgi:hypothetical protein
MDIWAFIFSAILILLGVLAISLVKPSYADNRRRRDERQRDVRWHALQEMRRMERRRDRIWMNVDSLYADFISNHPAGIGAEEKRPPKTLLLTARSDEAAGEWEMMTPDTLHQTFERFMR